MVSYDLQDLSSKIVMSRVMRPGAAQVALTREIESLYKALDVIEMSEGLVKRRKPNCVKGTACGYACISGKKLCSDKVMARDAAALLKSVNAITFTSTNLPSTKSLSDLKIDSASGLHLLKESAFDQTDEVYKSVVDTVQNWQDKHGLEKSSSLSFFKHDKAHIDLHSLIGEDSDGIRSKYGFTGELSKPDNSRKSGPTIGEEVAVQLIETLANNLGMTYKYGTMSVYNDFKTDPTAYAKDAFKRNLYMIADDKAERDRTENFVVDFSVALSKHPQLDKILDRQTWLLKKAKEAEDYN